jgi:hypothetical protein
LEEGGVYGPRPSRLLYLAINAAAAIVGFGVTSGLTYLLPALVRRYWRWLKAQLTLCGSVRSTEPSPTYLFARGAEAGRCFENSSGIETVLGTGEKRVGGAQRSPKKVRLWCDEETASPRRKVSKAVRGRQKRDDRDSNEARMRARWKLGQLLSKIERSQGKTSLTAFTKFQEAMRGTVL